MYHIFKESRKITTCNWMDLADIYTMEHELSGDPVKSVIWLLNLSPDHFDLHQEKNVKVHHKGHMPSPTFGGQWSYTTIQHASM